MNLAKALTPADDRRHRLAADPLERESLIFLTFLPEEDLGVIAYTWVDGTHAAGAMGLVFGRDNERFGQFHVEGQPVPADADFDDWTVGPMTVRHGAPHQEAQVNFEFDGVALDYRFRATTPAFTYHDNRGGCPAWLADNRLEQSGLVTGTLTIGDRVVAFDTTGHRDHSWGRRDWTAIHQYRWVNVQAGPDIAINFLHGSALDQNLVLGYVDRDGEQSPVTSASVNIERDREYFSYTSAEFVLVDELGRTTEITAEGRSALAVWPAGGLESHDAGGYCTVAGRRGLIHIEEGWHPEFVDRRRVMMAESFESEEERAVLAVNRDVGSVGATAKA
ncbi:DUF7064 domain-containing protein [Nocardia jinanensis]|uniref:Uncharacterized protein n=1 Tax=Nocardia jinanensis TaxID=382504 RepID=A0A917VUP0_9NOCA|nr:hypothetical protein [Nocardia jinanensis]GGL15876.1 hypothetical protein GCM10011588_33170 [Nocardia jinanensis]